MRLARLLLGRGRIAEPDRARPRPDEAKYSPNWYTRPDSMLIKVAFALLIALALVALLVSMQPATSRVVRSATMEAPPGVVYNLISNFHNWNAWSPWARIDPNM